MLQISLRTASQLLIKVLANLQHFASWRWTSLVSLSVSSMSPGDVSGKVALCTLPGELASKLSLSVSSMPKTPPPRRKVLQICKELN